MKIYLTGSTGFIGNHLSIQLLKLSHIVFAPIRNLKLSQKNIHENLRLFRLENPDKNTNYFKNIGKVDCLIHCAARTHVMRDKKKDSLDIYREANVEKTKKLAEEAAKQGIKRFIFLSSVKVNGEKTLGSNSFKYNDVPAPEDFYAISKFEAEKVLWEISRKTGLEVTVIRLPLVYGNGAKGNLERLIKLVRLGIPLPFSMIQNKRSMIGIDNLVDFLIQCIDHPNAAGKTFLVSDGKDLSTPNFINHISSSMGFSARLFPVPIFLLKFLFNILGKKKELDRLIGSLKLDCTHTREALNWIPPVNIAEGIRRMVQGK